MGDQLAREQKIVGESGTKLGTVSSRRRWSTAALSEKEEALLSIFDSIQDGVAVLDAEGKIKGVNNRLLEIVGVPGQRIVGKRFDLVKLISGKNVSEKLAGLLSGQEVSPFELETRAETGRKLNLQIHFIHVKRVAEIRGAIAVIRDISDQRRLEQELRAVDERNRLFVDNADEGIVVVQDDKVVFLNQRAADLSGRPMEELISKSFWMDVHSADQEIVRQQHLRRVRSEHVPRVYSFRVTRVDGAVRWSEVSAVAYSWEGRPAFLCFVKDITERKEAEERLRQSERRYRFLAENVSDVIWVTDMNLRPTYLSPSIKGLLGYSVEESMDHTIEGALTPASVEAVRRTLEGVVTRGRERSGKSGEMEVELKRKDGSTVWVSSTISFIRGPDGQPVEIIGVLRDISKRKLAEEALREAKAKLDLLFQQMPCLCWTTDIKLRFSSCAGALMSGPRLNEIIGTKLSDYYGVGDKVDCVPISAHRQALTGETASYEIEEDGRTFYCRVEPLRDAENDLLGVVGAAVEVTEYKNLVSQLRSLSRQLISVQENERRAIASELHDQVGQSLTALKLLLEKVQAVSERNGPQLVEAHGVVNELMTRVREMSLDLRPAMLDDLGLLPTLLWHFKRYTAQTNVKVKFRHAGLRKTLPPAVSIAAYRIVQESLTNVARYACVDEVSVCIRAERGVVLVEVADHGVGFDETKLAIQPSSGIRGMRERALALGGKFTVRSVSGRGTYVMAELPCRTGSAKDGE